MSESSQDEVFVGRQPIFDKNLKLYAYELLFRNCKENTANINDGDSATEQLIFNTFANIGLDKLIGNNLGFINLTRKLLINLPPLPKERIVLEILEDVLVDEELISAITNLHKEKYILALDDFIYNPSLTPLIELVDIVKIDILPMSEAEIIEHVRVLKEHNVALLAEKIETHEQMEFCKEQGFSYFQGYFLARPKLVTAKKHSPNRTTVLSLLVALQEPNMKTRKIEELLSQDATLSYKILKIINSAAYVKVNKIKSLHEAIVFMGIDKLKAWVSLILVSSVDGKSPELMKSSMLRAKMCEIIANATKKPGVDIYFSMGLFSNLDALLDRPMDDILTELKVEDEMRDAILNHKGHMGEVLKNVIAYEYMDLSILENIINMNIYRDAFIESIDWADKICRVAIE